MRRFCYWMSPPLCWRHQRQMNYWVSFGDLPRPGRGVVLITHKLDEALRIADRVTVLRQGVVTHSGPISDETASSLARAMIGSAPDTREPASLRSQTPRGAAQVLVRIEASRAFPRERLRHSDSAWIAEGSGRRDRRNRCGGGERTTRAAAGHCRPNPSVAGKAGGNRTHRVHPGRPYLRRADSGAESYRECHAGAGP